MNKNQLLDELSYMEILLSTMSPDNIDNILWHVEAFYNKHTNVRKSVLNAALIKAIQSTQGNSNYFSLNYLDKILDTFRVYKVYSASGANRFLENKNKHSFNKSKKTERFVPDWMDEFEQLLETE